MRRAAAVAIPLALVLAVLGGAACQRRTRFVPVRADSTSAVLDSFPVRVRLAQQQWDDPAAGEEGARLSAEIVRLDLERHPDEPWPPRVRALLDSLDFGAEVAADSRVVVVNFFSRAHPEAGSWPWLFWRAAGGAGARALSGRGLQLQQVASHADRSGRLDGVAALFSRRAASGGEPMLMVWGAPDRGGPEPVQTLGPDSLGGTGSSTFEATTDTSVVLSTTTFRAMPRFEECATCPHVFTVRRWRWGGSGFSRVETRPVPSPYSSFVLFVHALTTGDDGTAERYTTGAEVLDAAKRYEFGVVSRGTWRVAPATDETAHEMVFFRGQTEAYRVSFEPQGEEWVISGILPTARSIE